MRVGAKRRAVSLECGYSYRQWGEDCLVRLEGMYAFAIWDGARARLFCARDRLGIKPFYYAIPDGYFVFASKIKSLLTFPGLEAVADDDGVLSFLVHGNCDFGERIAGGNALRASHCLSLDISAKRSLPGSTTAWSRNP
jgi:asparagine synthase (glutamine-hydrolysing)